MSALLMLPDEIGSVLFGMFGKGDRREEWRVSYDHPNGWTYKSGGYSSRAEAEEAAGRIWPSGSMHDGRSPKWTLDMRTFYEWRDGSRYQSAWNYRA